MSPPAVPDWLAPTLDALATLSAVPEDLAILPARMACGGDGVALIGLVNRGKSVLFNQLLGEALSPVAAVPETSLVISARSGEAEPAATSPSSLKRSTNGGLRAAAISGPFRLPSGLLLIDTPGTLEAMVDVADADYDELWKQSGAGAAILVVALPAGVSRNDLALLESARAFGDRVLVIVKATSSDPTPQDLADMHTYTQGLISEVPVLSVPPRPPSGEWGTDPEWRELELEIVGLQQRAAADLQIALGRVLTIVEAVAAQVANDLTLSNDSVQRLIPPVHHVLVEARETREEALRARRASQEAGRLADAKARKDQRENERRRTLDAAAQHAIREANSALEGARHYKSAGILDWWSGSGQSQAWDAAKVRVEAVLTHAEGGSPAAGKALLNFVRTDGKSLAPSERILAACLKCGMGSAAVAQLYTPEGAAERYFHTRDLAERAALFDAASRHLRSTHDVMRAKRLWETAPPAEKRAADNLVAAVMLADLRASLRSSLPALVLIDICRRSLTELRSWATRPRTNLDGLDHPAAFSQEIEGLALRSDAEITVRLTADLEALWLVTVLDLTRWRADEAALLLAAASHHRATAGDCSSLDRQVALHRAFGAQWSSHEHQVVDCAHRSAERRDDLQQAAHVLGTAGMVIAFFVLFNDASAALLLFVAGFIARKWGQAPKLGWISFVPAARRKLEAVPPPKQTEPVRSMANVFQQPTFEQPTFQQRRRTEIGVGILIAAGLGVGAVAHTLGDDRRSVAPPTTALPAVTGPLETAPVIVAPTVAATVASTVPRTTTAATDPTPTAPATVTPTASPSTTSPVDPCSTSLLSCFGYTLGQFEEIFGSPDGENQGWQWWQNTDFQLSVLFESGRASRLQVSSTLATVAFEDPITKVTSSTTMSDAAATICPGSEFIWTLEDSDLVVVRQCTKEYAGAWVNVSILHVDDGTLRESDSGYHLLLASQRAPVTHLLFQEGSRVDLFTPDLQLNDFGFVQRPSGSPPSLFQGASGEWVAYLQGLLVREGFDAEADGEFGPATQAAVQQFQMSVGLTSDGRVGPNTWSALGVPS